MKENPSVVMLGMGYIGLPTAALIAQNEVQVHGVDINSEIVKTINEKLSVTSKFTYGLDYVTAISLDEISKEQDGNSLRIGALAGEFSMSADKYVVGEIHWQTSHFNGPKATAVLSGVQ